MEKSIFDKSYQLKNELQNDHRIAELNRLEKAINENEEVMALAYKKDMAADNYSEMVRLFKQDSEEAKTAMKALSEAKEKLDSHPLVREYISAYQKVRDLYEEMNSILFSSLNAELCSKEKK